MAISKNHTLENGLSCDKAYIRVEDIHVISKKKMSFMLRFYTSINIDKSFEDRYFTCPFELDGENLYIQAYRHLKTLDEFLSAIDC